MADRFKFTDDFDYKPTSQVTIAFRKGHEGEIVTGAAVSGQITNAVVTAAMKAGKGQKVGVPNKPSKD
ncbi:hypothetical protein [Devosia sp. MC521]|uniref:hypothetical protein n=1 Tax=Devosia sp. MC521 TaxID=2759954 RepID=UPI0015FC0A84|nr:hypothetical protein [Devosia sp. MC521]MBJ6986939.1 hypothetical protein [Devosia sp. MC521]QMW63963.1 hypothetical protein H4N61_06505 [Devosia sp. MC521]